MHPHDTLIRAWLDGKTVQYKSVAGNWLDLQPPGIVEKLPHFYVTDDYRLKPTVTRYRVWLSTEGTPHIASSLQQADVAEKRPTFACWLADWVEVES